MIRSTVEEIVSPMDEAVSFTASMARVMTGFFGALRRFREADDLREAALLRAATDRFTVALARFTRRVTEAFFAAVERFLLVPPLRRFAEAFPPRLAEERFADDFLPPLLRFADDFLPPDFDPERLFFVAMYSPFDFR